MPASSLLKRWLSKGLRLFFRLLYHQLAGAYDAVAAIVSMGMWKDWVNSVLPSVRGPNVLEIGHGPGHLLVALKAAGYRVLGLDESWKMSEIAVQRVSEVENNTLVVCGYAQFMPFPEDTFDTICATFPSEYILDPETLGEAFRVLVPGGRLIILPSAWFLPESAPGRFFSRLFGFAGLSQIQDGVYAQPLSLSGFQVSTHVRTIRSSQILIILAIKPETS